MQSKHTNLIVGLALAGSFALASCGSTSSAASKQVASLGGSTTAVAGAAGGDGGGGFGQDPARAKAFKDALLANAKCMRDNGVPTDDPTFDANGRPSGGRGRGGGRDTPPAGVTQATFDAANKVCDPILQKVRDAFKPDPAQQAARRKQLLDFAACMREKGADFADPTFDANGRPQFGNGGIRDKINNDPTLKADADACQAEDRGFRRPGSGNGGQPGAAPSTTTAAAGG